MSYSRSAILRRDSHKCAVCRIDTRLVTRVRVALVCLPSWPGYEYGNGSIATHGARLAVWWSDLFGWAGPGPFSEIHHKLPRSQGGTDVSANLETRCARCHRDTTNELLGELAHSTTQPGTLFKKDRNPIPKFTRWPSRRIQQRPDPWPKNRKVGQ